MKNLLHSAVATILPSVLQTRNKQRLSILTYHRVLSSFDYMRPTEPIASEFEWQMELLACYFNPLPLSEALSLMSYGELPERAVCVTFDDGYADNEEIALPVLSRWKVPATVFVATDFLNGGRMWNDTVIEALRIAEGHVFDLTAMSLASYSINSLEERRLAASTIIREIKHWPPEKRAATVEAIVSIVGQLPSNLMMTDDQVRSLGDGGMDIGAHTKSHPILSTLELDQIKEELTGSRTYLESILGSPVRHFAYPNGRPGIDYRIEHRDLVEIEGFDAAVSTQWGVASTMSDRWQLPRFTPWDKTPLRFMTRLLLNARNPA
jgi:peptidoglycan/xylan/chitin deacetylase (PgdA/CDA1 family)